MVRKQGPWGLWWLVGITFGIYYFVWYQRINRELSAVLGREAGADGQWWSQIIPIFGIIGLANTASRLNEAHGNAGSGTRVGVLTACLLAPIWFASQTRYLQRRMNVLADVLAARGAQAAAGQLGAATAPAPILATAPVEAQGEAV